MEAFCRCPKRSTCFPRVVAAEYTTVMNIMDATHCRSVRYTVGCISVICNRVYSHIEVKECDMIIPAKYVDVYLLWRNILDRYKFTHHNCPDRYTQDVVVIKDDGIWIDGHHLITPRMYISTLHSDEAIRQITAIALMQRDDLLY